jgi:hypothetical protein
MSKTVHLFQIYYDQISEARIAPGFTPLDNSANERPDWCEYWPIRKTLLNKTFDKDSYIGFFSPKFLDKTALTANDIVAKVQSSTASVLSFSPYFDQNAAYLNPFMQGDIYHPGLMAASQSILPALNLPLDLSTLVCDRTTTVFSNYFVATHAFWMQWFQYTEKLFALCENANQTQTSLLVLNTKHGSTLNDGTPMKVFIMERMVTLVLEHLNIQAQIGSNIESVSANFSKPTEVINQLLTLDALKGQYKKTRLPIYLQTFEWHRNKLLNH